MAARPATERTEHDLNPIDLDQGITALSKMVGSDKPVEVEEEAEEAEAEAETVEEDGESESSPDEELSEESETHSDDDEESETDEAETAQAITLADGTEISLEEAQSGYLRQSDYTKKSTALADERRQLGEQHAETTKRLESLVNELEQQATQEPDWDALIDEYGADQVLKSQMAWNQQKAARQRAVEDVQAQREQQQKQAVTAARGELLTGSYDPSWTDPKKLEAGLIAVSKYAEDTYGIPSRDLSTNTDPNVFVILDKARKYDALQKKAPAVKKVMVNKPKAIKPGSSSTVKAKPSKNAFAQARKTGTEEDAFAALGSLRRAS